MNLEISRDIISTNESGFRGPLQIVATLGENIYEQKSQTDKLTHLDSKENVISNSKLSLPTSIGLLSASNILHPHKEKCLEAGHDVQTSNEDYKLLLSFSNIKAQRIALNLDRSKTTSFSLHAKRFLVTWNGVLALIFDNFPAQVYEVKQITETSVNSIWDARDKKIPKENLGCRFPKITLGAPSDTYTFSIEDLTRLFSLCATMEHFEQWWVKSSFMRHVDQSEDMTSARDEKPNVPKNDHINVKLKNQLRQTCSTGFLFPVNRVSSVSLTDFMLAKPINVFSVELYPERQNKLGEIPNIIQYNTLMELSNQYVESVLSEISLSDSDLAEIKQSIDLMETSREKFPENEQMELIISSGFSFPKTFRNVSEYLLKCNKPCPATFPQKHASRRGNLIYERRITHYAVDHMPEASVICFLVPRIDEVELERFLSSLGSSEDDSSHKNKYDIPLISLEELDKRVYQAVSKSFQPKRTTSTTFTLDSLDFANLSKAIEELIEEFDDQLRFDKQKWYHRAAKRNTPHEQIIYSFAEGLIWSDETKQWHTWSDHIFSFMVYFNVFKFCVNETVPGVYTFFPFHALHVTIRNA